MLNQPFSWFVFPAFWQPSRPLPNAPYRAPRSSPNATPAFEFNFPHQRSMSERTVGLSMTSRTANYTRSFGPIAAKSFTNSTGSNSRDTFPSKPEMHHTYDSPRHTQIGGLDFYVDTWVRADGEKTDPGSDRQHIESLIHTKGYRMPAGMVYVRLVHLLDVEKRRELMIIYGEELPEGITAADLGERGKAHDQLPALEAAAVEHAKEKVRIDPLQS